jgi:dihydropteroate synthase
LAEPKLASVVARHQATLVIMHSRGPMSEMAGFSNYPQDGYADVVQDVAAEWLHARDIAVKAGVDPGRVWFDPGIGFAKNATQSYALLSRLDEFQRLQAVIVVGPSRKSFIAALDGAPPAQRLGGTVAACLEAAARGAQVLRVHDVRAVRQALDVRRAIDQGTMEDKLRA